jgi:uncharacterized membrane protein
LRTSREKPDAAQVRTGVSSAQRNSFASAEMKSLNARNFSRSMSSSHERSIEVDPLRGIALIVIVVDHIS